jgi:exodeoxyribonuclease V beta subunit
VREGFVTGEIDVLFEHDGSIWVADWKTNLAQDYTSSNLRSLVDGQYRQQVQLYAMAAAKTLGISDAQDFDEQFGGVLYLFVRGMDDDSGQSDEPRQRGVAEVTPAWSELVEYAQRIGEMAIGEGSE